MDEQNKYSGLVICADCGKTMALHRAHTMSADYNRFTCRTYKKDGEACTAHYIRECILDEIVLEDLRRVTAEAREHPQEFAEYLNNKQSAELQKEIRRLEKEKAAMQKRKAELDAIFKKLYEDSVLGRITAEQFQLLSASYTEEQAKLDRIAPAARSGDPAAERDGKQYGSVPRQSEAVHGHSSADTGAAAALHPEDRGA